MSQKNIKNNDPLLGQVIEKHGIPKEQSAPKKTCKNHKLVRTRNPIVEYVITAPIELIQIYDCKYGDSNDVIDAWNVRGTPSQIDEFAKEFFNKRVWSDLDDDSDGENIGYSMMIDEYNTISVDCAPIGYESNSWRSYIDMIYPNEFAREQPKYIINNNNEESD